VSWFDSHCHLARARAKETIDCARAAGVERLVTVGTDASTSREALKVAGEHEGAWATVGLHPHEASQGVDTIVGLLDECAAGNGAASLVAVGECGLDYHYDHSPRDVQRKAFADQVSIAHQRGLALVVHSRDAWDDTFTILESEGVPEHTVLHCFTGGPSEARRGLDLGAHLSFSGIVTFKKADGVRAAAAMCPFGRLLLETDAPYLAPVPNRGKQNQPAWLPLVGAAVAAVRRTAPEEVAEASWVTANRFFGLSPSA
jgi:TatD DNase family protein